MSAEASDTPILDLLGRMTADSMQTSTLDEQTLMLVRVAALVAVDAPPASYLLNLGAAGEVGVSSDQVTGVLSAVAPIVGTTRVVAAAGRMVKALGAAVELAELAEYADARFGRQRRSRAAGQLAASASCNCFASASAFASISLDTNRLTALMLAAIWSAMFVA